VGKIKKNAEFKPLIPFSLNLDTRFLERLFSHKFERCMGNFSRNIA